MYVWTGGNGNNDFIATINFDTSSPTYGTELSRTYLPANVATVSQANNEPHHCRYAVTPAGPRLVVGGLLSFLQGKDDIFVFDAADPFNVRTLFYSCRSWRVTITYFAVCIPYVYQVM